MKTTIFVAITIAALGAVGITTAIMSSGIPVHAQGGPGPGPGGGGCNGTVRDGTCITNGQQTQGPLTSGHTTTSGCTPGAEFCSFSDSGHVAGSGGGKVSVTFCGTATCGGVTKCVGSVDFQTATGCGPPPKTH